MDAVLIIVFAVMNAGRAISDKDTTRLVPGAYSGRLEVFHNGVWGTVCDPNFDNKAASVVCRSLSKPSKNAYWVRGQTFGVGSLTPRLSGVSCFGQEASLLNCTLIGIQGTNKPCSNPDHVVGIVCNDDAIQALFKIGNSWIDSEGTISVTETNSIYCYAGKNTDARDFHVSIKSKDIVLTSGTSYAHYQPTRAHKGPISCSVSNWQMPYQDTLSVDVVVMYPPAEFVRSEFKVFEATSVNVTLTNLPYPLPYLTSWRKAGTLQTRNQTEAYRMYSSISRADRGEYLVTISNKMNLTAQTIIEGTGLELIFVEVLYKPTVLCKHKYFVSEGSEVNITCQVDANPPPHVYIWTNSSGDIVIKGSKPSLHMAAVGPETLGRYQLTAVNNMEDFTGKMESGIGIDEIEILIGDGQSKNHTVNEQPSLVEKCHPNTQHPLSPLISRPLFIYVLIGIAAVALLLVIILSFVINKMRNAKGVHDVQPNRSNTIGRNSTNVYQEPAQSKTSQQMAKRRPSEENRRNSLTEQHHL